MKDTIQQKFWAGGFGKEYTDRNQFDPETLDRNYQQWYGITRSAMNQEFLKGLELKNILEVGCNVGNQLRLLQKQGYTNLTGIEIIHEAVERAKQLTQNINIIEGSAFQLPFANNSFDLVFTSGVLIHISPKDVKQAMAEIYRVSKKYIWGFEYYAPDYQEIEYRGQKDRLWKGDFAKMYLEFFPDLKLLKEKKYKYLADQNVDQMFLLEKP